MTMEKFPTREHRERIEQQKEVRKSSEWIDLSHALFLAAEAHRDSLDSLASAYAVHQQAKIWEEVCKQRAYHLMKYLKFLFPGNIAQIEAICPEEHY